MIVLTSSLWIHLLILTYILYQKLHKCFVPHCGSCQIDWNGARHLRWNPGRVSRFPSVREKRWDCRISWAAWRFERHNRCLPDWNDYSSVTVHAVGASPSLRIEAWILRWFTKSGLVCGNWLLDWQAKYIKDKYTVYIFSAALAGRLGFGPLVSQQSACLSVWETSGRRCCLVAFVSALAVAAESLWEHQATDGKQSCFVLTLTLIQ